MLSERKWSILLSSEANNVYDKEFHLFEFLMSTFSIFGGQLIIRKKKRQRKQSQVRDENLEDSK